MTVSPDDASDPGRCRTWVTLAPGVRISRDWLTAHAPNLFAQWQQAESAEHRRRLARQIEDIARSLESDPTDDD